MPMGANIFKLEKAFLQTPTNLLQIVRPIIRQRCDESMQQALFNVLSMSATQLWYSPETQ